MKGKTRPEMYILFFLGFSVQELMMMGYPKSSVYNQHAKYNNKIKHDVAFRLRSGAMLDKYKKKLMRKSSKFHVE